MSEILKKLKVLIYGGTATGRWSCKNPPTSQPPKMGKPCFPEKSYYFGKEGTPEIMTVTVPEGWIVYEMGQNPLFNLWYCTLVNMEQEKYPHVSVEDCDTIYDALNAAVKLIGAKT